MLAIGDRRGLTRDEQQVRPLLPASPDGLVVVTSRNQLTGLASTEGARLVTLDVLTRAEAIELLTTRVGAARPAFPLAALAAELRDRCHEATILTHLGDTRHAGGDLPRARDAWHQALAIVEDLDHPRAEEVSARLASLPAPVTE